VYTFRNHKRSKHIRITVRHNGTVLVTKPAYVSRRYAEEFVQSKSDWIQSQLNSRETSTYPELAVHTRAHFLKHKEEARILLGGTVERWNKIYGFYFNDIKVKQMSSRWGSCSSKKNLNFNYKLMFLPEKMIEYVVVHELCHLQEFNHSKQFWKLVERCVPDYKKIKKELSKIK
jgi:predicted metal-dependent hydrolase